MRKWWIAAAALAVTACGAQTPQEREADQLRDAAEAQADAIEAQAGNVSAGMKAEAEQLRQRQNKRLCVFNAIHIAQGSLNIGRTRQIQRKACAEEQA